MTLQISARDGAVVLLTYEVVPLTAASGLNQSEVGRKSISFRGNMVSATATDYVSLNSSDTIAYLSCDATNASYISPTEMVNALMSHKPRAILLYSIDGNCCGLQGSNLPYNTLYTMTSAAEATDTLNIITLTNSTDGLVRATITGNVTSSQQEDRGNQNGSNSAIAMSILYSITGLITLLFLAIIATGAIRAHRYPDRYGPRSGYGGRPGQSRAKGLARAVLETLPIVKFGDPELAKPDPALELETQTERPSPDAIGIGSSAIPEEPQPQQRIAAQNAPTLADSPNSRAGSIAGQGSSTRSNDRKGEDEHLGCSICTDDFTVGEDVRVLPCNHKFHPPCIDPWLINVSGTCPLCRLDLRPRNGETQNADELTHLPPPLEGEGGENEASSSQRRRSRLLDLHRLRHATVEERIEILRRHRSHQRASALTQPGDREGEGSERGQAARLADRLRDKFLVRTRAQSPERTPHDGGQSSS